MFESLSDRLSEAFRNLTGRAQLNEDNIQSGLREVRLALLEADVNFNVVKQFIDNVRTKCLGHNILKGINPAQQVIKIVHEELVNILGGETSELNLKGQKPAQVMLVGLQGSGKTTSAGKIANLLRKQKKKPYLVPLDVYRPAAIDQLMSLAKQLNIPCFPSTIEMKPAEIAEQALLKANELEADVMLLDTAGRLHVDEPLMNELLELKTLLNPQEILFVADAMTGQDAVNVAQAFHEKIGITGVVLTKMDGDARGGAALSIKSVLGASVKFVGMGEKLSEMEVFHPDRVAGRILGMGDVLSLVEKAQENINMEEAAALAKKMQKAKFDFEDFRTNLRRLRKMGSFESLLGMIPGFSQMKTALSEAKNMMPDKEFAKVEAMIGSMTDYERHHPDCLIQSRRIRIAKGSGNTIQDVDKLVSNFKQMRDLMKNLLNGKGLNKIPREMRQMMPNFNNMPGMANGLNIPGLEESLKQASLPGFGLPTSNSRNTADRKKKKKEKRKHGKK